MRETLFGFQKQSALHLQNQCGCVSDLQMQDICFHFLHPGIVGNMCAISIVQTKKEPVSSVADPQIEIPGFVPLEAV